MLMKPRKDLLTLALRIRNLRMMKRYSQMDMAVALDIQQSAYQRKEAGTTRFKREELMLLSELFQTPVWEFFWDEKDRVKFTAFAEHKGFICKESVEKKRRELLTKVFSLQKEIDRLKKTNRQLEEDKHFLRELLDRKKDSSDI